MLGSVDPVSPLHGLMNVIQTAFMGLVGKPLQGQSLERIGILVYEAMSTRNRSYHRLEHVLDTPPGNSPLQTLAYVFHDLVYWQIDRSRHPVLRRSIAPLSISDQGTVSLGEYRPPVENDLEGTGRIARAVFGFERAGDIGVTQGMNEFLSSVVLETMLKPVVNPWQLIGLIACIEGTRPFRALDGEGRGPFHHLANRVWGLNERLHLKREKGDVEELMRAVVTVSHHDVAGFASEDPGSFLSHTWSLIWEGNPALQRETYKVREFRECLYSTFNFYSSLTPEKIFHSYCGFPEYYELNKMHEAASRNLAIGKEYIRAKLLAIALVEAVAEATGGDAPLLLFFGFHPAKKVLPQWESLIRNLPSFKLIQDGIRFTVQMILETGRFGEDKFDVSRSPVAAFLYSHLERHDFEVCFEQAKLFLDGKSTSEKFLNGKVSIVSAPVLERLAEIGVTRRSKIRKILGKW